VCVHWNSREPREDLVIVFPSYPIFGAQFLKFGHDAIGDAGRAFRVQAVHHGAHHLGDATESRGRTEW